MTVFKYRIGCKHEYKWYKCAIIQEAGAGLGHITIQLVYNLTHYPVQTAAVLPLLLGHLLRIIGALCLFFGVHRI